MHRICLFFALALTVLLAAGCAVPTPPPPPEETEAPPVLEPALPENDGGAEIPPEGATETFLRELPVTVDGGRDLTLRVHCRRVASGYGTWDYSAGSMDVLEGETLLQTLSVGDAIRDAWEDEDASWDDWTSGFEDGFLPTLEDLNFDGAQDIRLLWFTGVVNRSWLCWLWDAEAGQFSYAFTLSGYDFAVDQDRRELSTQSRNGYGQYYTNVYAYGADGALQSVRVIHQDMLNGTETTQERIDGQWVQTDQRPLAEEP